MSYQAKIKRYLLILQKLENSEYPSAKEIIQSISEHGLKLSDRQLKRDIESFRFEFGLEIQYSAYHRGYCVETSKTVFPYFLKLLEFSQNAELLSAYLKQGLDISGILNFENYNSFKGTDFIQGLTLSIFNLKKLKLTYLRFNSETPKKYMFHPYLLREYMSRWYVIGFLAENREIRTFGLDRIIQFSETGKRFKQRDQKKITDLFRYVVGINASVDDKPVILQLSCQPYLANLLKTLPLHSSQTVISETNNEVIFSYKVVVNYELKQRLLMLSNQSHVLGPQTLKEEMKQILTFAQKNY